jgi:FkbM family methyltransferase
MFYDYIEIGTSDFNTEIQKKDNKVGISIEPVKYYLDKLPNKNNCIKLNIACSNHNGLCTIYYIPESNIIKYKLPQWVKGCNSINSYHKTVEKLCNNNNLNIEEISDNYQVETKKLSTIIENMNVKGIYYLKIDTEGHDCVILKEFHNDIVNNDSLPHLILFESNILSNKKEIDNIINLFINKGYDLIYRNTDTELQLNLKKIKNKSHFSDKIKKYYIMDYPKNYNIKNLPHKNTLEDAQKYCIKHNCSGITYQNNIYQVRNGKYMKYYNDNNLISWVYL